MATSIPGVPVFKLYGEQAAWPTPDLLHCESISERSSQHHWEIKPHRHADLFQLLFVQRGRATVDVEGRVSEITEPSIQVIAPLCVHGFQFSESIEGYVLTLGAPLVAQLEAQLGAPLSVLTSSACYPLGADSRSYNTLFAALYHEYEGRAPARELVMSSLVNVLMVWISRRGQQTQATVPKAGTDERNRQLLGGYIKLVEQHFREHLTVETFAHRLNISGVHLNNLCRQLAGKTALQILHERLMLEAKRNLTYTTVSVSQLSDALGFSDPTYFSRFFRRLAGVSPNAFRQGRE